jgi:hypothetical protein
MTNGEWEKELSEKPAELDWFGWTEGCGSTAVDFFNYYRPDTSCKKPCKNCGFHYLDAEGNELKRAAVPLCGVW